MTLGLFFWVLSGFLGGGVWFGCGREKLVDWLVGWLVFYNSLHCILLMSFVLYSLDNLDSKC